MPDEGTNTTAAATATNAPAQPGEQFKVPDGHKLVKADEYETLSRHASIGKGASDFYSRAKGLGFEKPEDFDTWKPVFDAAKKKGFKPDFLSRVLSADEQAEAQNGQGQNQPAFDPEAFKKSVIGDVRKEAALEKHEAALKAEPDLLKNAVKGLLSEGASEREQKALLREIRAEVEDIRRSSFYPEDHPLRNDHFMPLNEAMVQKAVAAIKAEMDADKAAKLAAKGDKARAQASARPASIAGNGGNQGGPKDEEPNMSPRAKLREAVKAAAASLGG